jgi:hypothetical protein
MDDLFATTLDDFAQIATFYALVGIAICPCMCISQWIKRGNLTPRLVIWFAKFSIFTYTVMMILFGLKILLLLPYND